MPKCCSGPRATPAPLRKLRRSPQSQRGRREGERCSRASLGEMKANVPVRDQLPSRSPSNDWRGLRQGNPQGMSRAPLPPGVAGGRVVVGSTLSLGIRVCRSLCLQHPCPTYSHHLVSVTLLHSFISSVNSQACPLISHFHGTNIFLPQHSPES